MMYGEKGLLDLSTTKALVQRDLNARQFGAELVNDAVDPDEF